MKKITLSILLTFLTGWLYAQELLWAKQMGGNSSDYGLAIATDASVNVYTTGYFIGTVDFDPGPGVFNLTSVGSTDIFITKFDAGGNLVWAKAYQSPVYTAGMRQNDKWEKRNLILSPLNFKLV